MNNSNGHELMRRISAGALVTIRDARGALVTGRAYKVPSGFWRVRTAGTPFADAVSVSNIVQVQS